jgi:hypothetical protein
MQIDVYRIEEDKLPIKYILGIEQQFPEFPDAIDIVYGFIQRAIKNPDRHGPSFTKHALLNYHAKGREEQAINGLSQAIALGLIECTCETDGKESYTILKNPFI